MSVKILNDLNHVLGHCLHPGHPVTAVRPRVEAGEADTRLLATATETYRKIRARADQV